MKYYYNDFGLPRDRHRAIGGVRNATPQNGSAMSVNSQDFFVSSNGDEEVKEQSTPRRQETADIQGSINRLMVARMDRASQGL